MQCGVSPREYVSWRLTLFDIKRGSKINMDINRSDELIKGSFVHLICEAKLETNQYAVFAIFLEDTLVNNFK